LFRHRKRRRKQMRQPLQQQQLPPPSLRHSMFVILEVIVFLDLLRWPLQRQPLGSSSKQSFYFLWHHHLYH
jgi:hypothetical protein